MKITSFNTKVTPSCHLIFIFLVSFHHPGLHRKVVLKRYLFFIYFPFLWPHGKFSIGPILSGWSFLYVRTIFLSIHDKNVSLELCTSCNPNYIFKNMLNYSCRSDSFFLRSLGRKSVSFFPLYSVRGKLLCFLWEEKKSMVFEKWNRIFI